MTATATAVETQPGIVVVTWDDVTSSSEWGDTDDARAWKGYEFAHTCRTAGWLLANNNEFVVVAGCWTEDLQNVNLVQRIPKGCVRSIERGPS